MGSSIERRVEEQNGPAFDSIAMSDGSILRAAHLRCKSSLARRSVVLLGGWGDVASASRPITGELNQFFDVVIVESREKPGSVVNKSTRNDLERLALDVLEVTRHYSLIENEVIIYGYSWGALIAARVVSRGFLRPCLTVLCTPIERLVLPPLTRFLIPFAPVGFMRLLKPLVEYWIVRFKSNGPTAALSALRALRSANLGNWKAVGRANLSPSLAVAYAELPGPLLVIFENGDRFHSQAEYERIARLTPAARHVHFSYAESDLPRRIVHEIRDMLAQRTQL
jgi:pimeloyl-ACP methyl ester carboxylesterase